MRGSRSSSRPPRQPALGLADRLFREALTNLHRLGVARRAPVEQAKSLDRRIRIAAVVAYLRKRTASAELAADLTAETFAEALLAVHRGRAEQVPNGIAWLLGIARHKLIDSYRSADAQDLARAEIGLPRLEIDDAELERIDRLAGREQPAVAALERLSVDEREAIVERILRERNYEEIARDLGHGEATIRKRVSRGLARMRQQMGAQIP